MKQYVLACAACAAMLSNVQAADVLVLQDPEQPVYTGFVDNPLYIQLLGGATLGLDATFYLGGVLNVVDPTRVGYAAAGTVGFNVGSGFSVEADVLHTFRDEVAAGLDTYATTSLMGNVKYTLPITEMIDVYAAVGVGYIWVNNFDGPPVNFNYEFGGFGYQLIGGTSVAFTDNIAGLAEVRFQNTFSDFQLMGNATLNLPTASLLAGVKFSF